jgi:hypothetical protein
MPASGLSYLVARFLLRVLSVSLGDHQLNKSATVRIRLRDPRPMLGGMFRCGRGPDLRLYMGEASEPLEAPQR